jgi:hypothetical protein
VHTRDLKTGESTDVCSKHRTDGLKEAAIISVEPKELTFIHTIRRAGGPGESELGLLPLMPGMGSLPVMAMIDPEAFANLQIGMHGMPMVMMPKMKMQLDQLKMNGPEVQKQMEEMRKQLKNMPPIKFNQKQMDELNKQLKELKPLSPLPGQPEQPEAPESPKP